MQDAEDKIAVMLSHSNEILRHSIKVFCLVSKVIDYLPEGLLSKQEVRDLLAAALFHDLGKAFWRKEWFTRPKRLINDSEWAYMQIHPLQAVVELQQLGLLSTCGLQIIEQHHERPGEKGYPKHVEPEITSLILSACDVFAACTEPRSYREKALSDEDAIKELEQFTPSYIVDAIRKAIYDNIAI